MLILSQILAIAIFIAMFIAIIIGKVHRFIPAPTLIIVFLFNAGGIYIAE